MSNKDQTLEPLARAEERPVEEVRAATIMMVDDEPTTIDVLEMFLQGEGYENFVRLTDSRLALEAISEQRPDVLLLDLKMPHVGGLEILQAMRDDEELRHIPVIILTSSTDAETKLQALEFGATDFLGKPVDPSELALRLRNTLEAKAYRDRIAYFDAPTGLPNRRLFMERLKPALRRAGEASAKCALLRIEIDRFRQIRDTLGQSVGDALLRASGERLEKCLDPADPTLPDECTAQLLSRVGGSEFVLALVGVGSAAHAAAFAKRALSVLAEPIWVDGQELFASASAGIGLFPDDGDSGERLMEQTGIATQHALRSGGNSYQFYNASLNAQSLERLGLETRLRRALERDELSLVYQPKVDVQSGRIVGAEALMRWQHPELGNVSPERFIPIAEETGLIGALGRWALVTACRQNDAWRRAGHPPIKVAVNVSSRQFRAGNVLEMIRSLVSSGLDSSQLVLELTESAIMENPNETSATLRAIKELGVTISVDDFGTGYSSLSYLKRLPLDELKIDRSFVQGIPGDEDDVAIVTAVIMMAHSLGLRVVAEGVETPEQLALLRERGCDVYQGYLCSRPAAPEAWPALFARAPEPA